MIEILKEYLLFIFSLYFYNKIFFFKILSIKIPILNLIV